MRTTRRDPVLVKDGGDVIATGTPEDVAKSNTSYIGQYIKAYFNGKR